MTKKATRYKTREAAAKRWAADHGYRGARGGWIYGPDGRTVTQGWGSFALMLGGRGAIVGKWTGGFFVVEALDETTRRISAFGSFADLVNAAGNYRPTIRPESAEHVALADAYDAVQSARGDARRAYRGR